MAKRERWELIDRGSACLYVRQESGTLCFTYNIQQYARWRKQGMSRDLALWHSLTRFRVWDNDNYLEQMLKDPPRINNHCLRTVDSAK